MRKNIQNVFRNVNFTLFKIGKKFLEIAYYFKNYEKIYFGNSRSPLSMQPSLEK